MEETKKTLKSEVDVSDSWTLVDNDSDEGNANVEPNEPSDSESLEVLEVEHDEPEENSGQDDNESVGEKDSCNDCTVKDSDDSSVSEDSVIHLASVQKGKKYVHHPSAYINMWLSIVMVIAVAITLGLGIGHYVGSTRFAKARDMVNQLKYENKLLEQELANTVVKQKLCGNDLRYRDSIFGNLTRGNDENVCYADEHPVIKRNVEGHSLNMAMPILLQWYSNFIVHDKQNPLYSNNQDVPNRSFLHSKLVKGDSSMNVNYFSKLHKTSDEKSQKSQDFVFKLNNQLTFLHSLFKKWGEFRENLALQGTNEKVNGNMSLPIVKQLHNSQTISSVEAHVSETCRGNNNNNNDSNNSISMSSSNGYCRLKVNQCVLREENWKNKKSKCKVLPKGQLFCSILFGNKKHRNVPLNKNSRRDRKEVNKLEAQKFALKSNKFRRAKEGYLNNEDPSVDIKNSQLKEKKQNRNVEQKNVNFQIKSQKKNRSQEKNNFKMHKHPTSNAKKLEKKTEGEISFQKEKKEKHYENNKHKTFFKIEKGKEKREKERQYKKSFEKKQHKKFQHENKELPKYFKKMSERDKKINSKNFIKHNGKKGEYSERHNWNKHHGRSSEKYYSGKTNPKFCMKEMQFEKHLIHLKFDEPQNFYYKSEKNYYKNKNFSENGNFKYGFDKYHKGNNYQKNWKEKRKVHYTNVQAINVYKS